MSSTFYTSNDVSKMCWEEKNIRMPYYSCEMAI